MTTTPLVSEQEPSPSLRPSWVSPLIADLFTLRDKLDLGGAGSPGADGAPGADGTNGTNGTDGTNGTNGTDGVGVPTGGTTGQALTKASDTDYDTHWTDETGGSGLPSGGAATQVLAKNSDTDGDAGWVDPGIASGYFEGGTTGQVLTKNSGGGFDFAWADPSGGGGGGSGLVPVYAYGFDWTDNGGHSGVAVDGSPLNFQVSTSGKGTTSDDAVLVTLENSYFELNTVGAWALVAEVIVTGLVPGDVVLMVGAQDNPTWSFVCPPGQTQVIARVIQNVVMSQSMVDSWSPQRWAFNYQIYSAQSGVAVSQEALRAILMSSIDGVLTTTDDRPTAPTGATATASATAGAIDFAWAGGTDIAFAAYAYRADQIYTGHVYDDWSYNGSTSGDTALTLSGLTSGEVYTCWIMAVDPTTNKWSVGESLGTVTVA